jgi:hypothetical protein
MEFSLDGGYVFIHRWKGKSRDTRECWDYVTSDVMDAAGKEYQ